MLGFYAQRQHTASGGVPTPPTPSPRVGRRYVFCLFAWLGPALTTLSLCCALLTCDLLHTQREGSSSQRSAAQAGADGTRPQEELAEQHTEAERQHKAA